MSRLADDGALIYSSHEGKELGDHALIEHERGRQLDEDGTPFLCEAVCLSQKCDERLSCAP